ncbi:MAG: RNB domain-containing ribonuclease [Neisseriales bacterium]|nr:MAG: RNB domain-containing ribonuclease [Neisseriales bacterium]
MNLLYEANKTHQVGQVIRQEIGVYWVQTATQQSVKVKSQQVILMLTEDTDQFLPAAERLSNQIDIQRLWESSDGQTMHFASLAHRYFVHWPSATEKAATWLKLRAMPMYFYRQSDGYFKPATATALKAALISIQKKQSAQQQIEAWSTALLSGQVPDAMGTQWTMLLHQPDKQSCAYRALRDACRHKQCTPLQLALELGAISSVAQYFLEGFLLQYFPIKPKASISSIRQVFDDLPLSDVAAFSIDDAHTTEIDDAFSLRQLPDGSHRVGIHIALPAIGIEPDLSVDALLWRCATVYLPDQKITLFPYEVIEQFSMNEGTIRPAMSLYIDVDEQYHIKHCQTQIDKIRIQKNFDKTALEIALSEALTTPHALRKNLPSCDKLIWLIHFTSAVASQYTKPSPSIFSERDFDITVFDNKISVRSRQRNTPIDCLVSTMMILANQTWSQMLAQSNTIAMYRSQNATGTYTTLSPRPHARLNLQQYAWCTSPLRRAADFINQSQLIALLTNTNSRYLKDRKTFLMFAKHFDKTYSAYLAFQRQMTRCWALRYLVQEHITTVLAKHIGHGVCQLENLPLRSQAIPSLASLRIGEPVVLEVVAIDEANQLVIWRVFSKTKIDESMFVE